MRRAREPAPRDRGPAAAGRRLEQRAQRLPQRRRRPGRRARPGRSAEPADRGHRRQPPRCTMPWVDRQGRCRCPPTRPRPLGPAARRRAAPSSTRPRPAPTVQLAAFQAAISTVVRRRPSCAAGSPAGPPRRASTLDLDLRWRLLVQLATLGAVDRAELDAALDARAHRPVAACEHARAVASLPDAEAKAWAWERLHRRGRRAQLRARGGRAAACGAVGQEHLTDAVRRPLLRRPARHRRGAQRLGARRGRRGLLPAHLADPGDPARGPRRSSPTPTSTCRCAAGWSTRPTTCGASSRSARPTRAHDHARPPERPPARTDGPDAGARARHRRASDATRTGWPPRSRWRSGWPGRARRRAGSG